MAVDLRFEPNRGQFDARPDYRVRGAGYALFLSSSGPVLRLGAAGLADGVLRIELSGASPQRHEARSHLPGTSHYLRLDQPDAPAHSAEHYAEVVYRQAWPGIDLVYYGVEGRLEYDFVLAPGADPGRLALRLDGADAIELAPDGALRIALGGHRFEQRAPVAFQYPEADPSQDPTRLRLGSERRVQVPARYRIEGTNRVAIEVGDHDPTLPLIVDPVLVWSSFVGGNGEDLALAVAEHNGEAYVTGRTLSTDFPTTAGVLQPGDGAGVDCFVSRFNATGSALLWSTYLGGVGDQQCNAIAVHSDGSVYVAGVTSQADAQGDAFLARLSAAGSALTFPIVLRAGNARDEAQDLTINGSGEAFVVGLTESSDFPTTAGVVQVNAGPGRGAFAFRVAANGTVGWSTYLDGVGDQEARAVALDGNGNVYVAGRDTGQSVPGNGFVLKLNGSASSIAYSRQIGGSGADAVLDLGIDASTGQAFFAGYSESPDLPTTTGALQPGWSGDRDGMLGRLHGNGSIAALSYLGGPRDQEARALGRDGVGNVYVAGLSEIADLNGDAFLLKTGPEISTVHYNLQFGGNQPDAANDLAVGGNGDVWLVGETASGIFPATAGSFRTIKAAGNDGFVMKLGLQASSQTLVQSVSVAGTSIGAAGTVTSPAVTLQSGDLVTVEATGGSVIFNTAANRPCAESEYAVGPAGHPASRGPIDAFSLCYSLDAPYLPDPVQDPEGVGHAGLFRPQQAGIGSTRFIGAGSETFTYSGGAPASLRLGINDQAGTSNSGQFQVRTTIVRGNGSEPVSMLSVDSPALAEGNAGNQSLVFTVSLAPARSTTVTVRARTANRSAIAGIDYTAVNQVLSFAPGETSKTVAVSIAGNTAVQPDRRFSLELVNPINASTHIPRGIGTIVDDDFPVIAVTGTDCAEGDTGTRLCLATVSVSVAPAQPLRVNLSTLDASAVAPGDYAAISNQRIEFLPGGTLSQSIPVTLVGDYAMEPSETFSVNLSNPHKAVLGAASANMTIVNDDQAGQFRLSASAYAADENGGGLLVTVQRVDGLGAGTSVSCSSVNGSAVAPGDYTATSVNLAFAGGQTSRTFSVPIVGDALHEINETFSVSLSNPTGGATLGSPAAATVTLTDNDAAPTLSIDNGGCSVTEGNSGSVDCGFVFRLSAASGRATSFSTATANGTASAGSDYSGHAATARSIPAGQTTLTVNVPVLGDALHEVSETFTLNASSVVGATPGSLAATGSIIDDDAAPTLSIDAGGCSVIEGDSGSTDCSFVFRLSAASGRSTDLSTATANGTAIAGSDYTGHAATARSIPAGQTMLTVHVPVLGDTLAEDAETFLLSLGSVSGAVPAQSGGIGTILDDDPPPVPGTLRLAQSTLDVTEGEASLVLTVLRSGGSQGTVSVDFTTGDGSAIAPQDYSATSGTLQFADAQTSRTVLIDLVDDALHEHDETLTLVLSNPGGGADLGSPDSITINLLDDDPAPLLSVQDSGCKVNEGDSGERPCRFVFRLSAVSGRDAGFVTATVDDTAEDGQDYLGHGPIARSIEAGQISLDVNVPVLGDLLPEADESFLLLFDQVEGATPAQVQASGLILDDELAPEELVFDSGFEADEGR